MDALRMPVGFLCLKSVFIKILLGVKLVGYFIEILIFSEQSDRSRCLPKSRIFGSLQSFRKLG